jgi:2-methylcitrate dehydratase PrpD
VTDASAPLRPWDEALVLGTASHALDYDDVCMLAVCHPSSPVVSALMALLPVVEAVRPGLRFDQLLAAYLVGTETLLRLGEWLGYRHYALGFHATSTLGAVGAAAACAHALDLPDGQARAALSIAASSACGLRANFGTDVKPLHVGFAAAAGLRAVLLARAGAQASDDVWGAEGFALAFAGGMSPADAPWRSDTPWAIESPGFEHKRFPSCYLTHRLIAGVLRLRERQSPALRGLPVSIDVELPKTGRAALKYPRPVTGLEGKFSAEYCAAAAWIDGGVGLHSFTDVAVQRQVIMAAMSRVVVHERAGADEPLDRSPVRVCIRHAQGEDAVLVDWAPGSLADPLAADDLVAKWADCAGYAGVQADQSLAQALLEGPLDANASHMLGPLRRLMLSAAGVSVAQIDVLN